MGDSAGQLFYGVSLTEEEAEELLAYFNENETDEDKHLEYATHLEGDPNAEAYLLEDESLGFLSPNETEQYFIVVKGTHKTAFNEAEPIGKTLSVTGSDEKLVAALARLELPARESQWFLCGNYE